MAVNMVVISGTVRSLALRYDAQARPELRWTLQQQEGEFSSWWPCCAPGNAAERLAGEIADGQHILVTSGKLCFRKRSVKGVEQSRMEILVWSIAVLQGPSDAERSGTAEDTSGSDEATVNLEPSGAAETTQHRKPRYAWKPGHVN